MPTPEEKLAAARILAKRKAGQATQKKKEGESEPGAKKTATGTGKATSTTITPYGGANFTEFIKKHKIKGAADLYEKPIGHQKQTTTGFYGQDVPESEWRASNPKFLAEFEKDGKKFDPKNSEHLAAYDTYYNKHVHDSVYNKALDDFKKSGKSDSEAADLAEKTAQEAVANIGFRGTPNKDVSAADRKWGHFYRSRKEIDFEPEAEAVATTAGTTTPAAGAEAKAKKQAMATEQQSGHDPWWLQDIVKTAGAAGDFFRVKKYAPWQATPGVKLPDPTFYDPNRELAANAEMANIGAQGQAAFTNPQAFAAAYSAIQGQGAKNAADILSRYNNMNVGVANDFEMKRTDIMNQASANRAGLATQLADKYTIMNQQFDNSKNMARQNLRQSYIDAVTNKNYTGNLNDLYDQYKIDPSSGGRIRWTHGRPITPEDSADDTISKINSATARLMEQNPGLTRDKAIDIASKFYGQGTTSEPKIDPRMGYPG